MTREMRYEGLLAKADPLLHAQLAEVVEESAPKGARVLDFGAGEGALAQRLADLGYDVLAVDVDAAHYGAKVPFERLDAHDRAALERFVADHRGAFDLVLAVEVIEHVENPWELVRSLAALAKPGGRVVVSTPNVTSAFSRAWFLVRGRMAQFDENDLAYGHIHPLTDLELCAVARGAGLEVERLQPGGRLGLLLPGLAPKVLLLNLAAVVASPFMKGLKRGYCLIAVLRKP